MGVGAGLYMYDVIVENLAVQTVWAEAPFTRYNRLSNPLSNWFDNRLYRVYKQPVWQNGCIVYTASCETGCTTRFDKRLNEQSVHSTRLSNRFDKHDLTTGCIVYTNIQLVVKQVRQPVRQPVTGWMFVYTIQPVVKPVVQPVWQPVVSCKRGFIHHDILQLNKWVSCFYLSFDHFLCFKTKLQNVCKITSLNDQWTRNSSEDETANMNFLRHRTRIQWNNAK